MFSASISSVAISEYVFIRHTPQLHFFCDESCGSSSKQVLVTRSIVGKIVFGLSYCVDVLTESHSHLTKLPTSRCSTTNTVRRRCLVAECRSEVVTAALGGINAHVFLQMGQVERKATLDSVIGREIRCVVGGNGAEATADANNVDCFASSGGGDGCSDWGGGDGKIPGRVEFRVERIASANPAADLAHLLSHE